MSNKNQFEIVSTNNNIATNLVTSNYPNSHCIVCGKVFQTCRVGKLYCSPRCKQFGYNHKKEVSEALAIKMKGISEEPVVFYIDDFLTYKKKEKTLKRYRELSKKQYQWELIDQEVRLKGQNGVSISDYTLGTYFAKKLTESEGDELYQIESEYDDRFLQLESRELTLEQWSFIKCLYAINEEIGLFELISSLSKEFLDQVTIGNSANGSNLENLQIRNKFINHCNLIANGVIKFLKKDIEC